MSLERFVAGQRRKLNFTSAAFVILLSGMWAATLCDRVFNLGWGWDSKILWAAPPMVLFAVVLRFLCMVIFRFVGGEAKGS